MHTATSLFSLPDLVGGVWAMLALGMNDHWDLWLRLDLIGYRGTLAPPLRWLVICADWHKFVCLVGVFATQGTTCGISLVQWIEGKGSVLATLLSYATKIIAVIILSIIVILSLSARINQVFDPSWRTTRRTYAFQVYHFLLVIIATNGWAWKFIHFLLLPLSLQSKNSLHALFLEVF